MRLEGQSVRAGLLAHKIPLLPATPLDPDYSLTLHALERIAKVFLGLEVDPHFLSAEAFAMLREQREDTLAHAPTSLPWLSAPFLYYGIIVMR